MTRHRAPTLIGGPFVLAVFIGCLPVPTFSGRPAFVADRKADDWSGPQMALGTVYVEQSDTSTGETGCMAMPHVHWAWAVPLFRNAELFMLGSGTRELGFFSR